MTASPGRDQDTARVRDLRRRLDLLRAHLAGQPMTAAERYEADIILARPDIIGEPPDVTAARQRILLDLAAAETVLRDILSRPHYRIRNGQACAELTAIDRLRARLTGIPPAADEPAHH